MFYLTAASVYEPPRLRKASLAPLDVQAVNEVGDPFWSLWWWFENVGIDYSISFGYDKLNETVTRMRKENKLMSVVYM